MHIYVFGNEDLKEDNLPFKFLEKLKSDFKELEFKVIKPNEDLPFSDNESVIILDTVAGIKKVELITEKDLDKFILPPRSSVHDFDLGFQLKYLKKLGKLRYFFIIGLPQEGETDYSLIHSIFKKLVAQDIQGS